MSTTSRSICIALLCFILGVSGYFLAHEFLTRAQGAWLLGTALVVLASALVLAALRPDTPLSRALLRPSTKDRLSASRWARLRTHLLLSGAGTYFMAAMMFLMGFTNPSNISPSVLMTHLVFFVAGMSCFGVAIAKRLKSREA